MQTAIANGADKDIKVFEEIIRCFGGKLILPDDVISTYINGGHKLHYRRNFNCKLYKKGLKGFFNSEFLEKVWLSRRSYRSQFLDERFDNVYLALTSNRNNILHELKVIRFFNMSQISDSILKDCTERPIVHICNEKHKVKTYKRLEDLGVIKC